MISFAGKTIFITGASSGIGAALARSFAGRGGQVICTARRKNHLQTIIAEIEDRGGRGVAYACDVSQKEELEAAVERGLKAYGSLDVVVANAGLAVVGAMDQLSVEDYRAQFETNLFGTLQTIYATLPALKKSRGTLVLIGSMFGYLTPPFSSPYSMSKFALRSLADAIRHELAEYGISVLYTAPGFVTSELRKTFDVAPSSGGLLASVPFWLEMPTEKCAEKIVTAVYKKKSIKVITLHARVLIFLDKYFHRIFYRFLNGPLVRKLFPKIVS
jgi:short-subunit dehydrogenase